MKKNRFYYFIRALATPLTHFLFPFRTEGFENIPREGAAVLCMNHISMLDPVMVAITTRRYIRYISKKELFSNRFLSWFFTHIGMFPVGRGESDMTAMRTMLSILKDGGVLGIFPQGHRHRDDDDRTMESGAAIVCLRARVPVIPIHIQGPVRLFRKSVIRVGRPLALDDIRRIDAAGIQEANRRLIEGIWEDAAKEEQGVLS